MPNTMRTPFFLCAWLLVTVIAASGQYGVPLSHTDPKLEPVQVRELVAQYCRLDYAGARLNPAEWPKVQSLVAWRDNPEFPLFMVTSRFDVNSELDFEHGKYEVTVRYRVLGKYDLSEGYSQDFANQVQSVRFTVSEVNGEWRITLAEPNYPHPSKSAALQWINQKLSESSDPLAKTMYQHALEGLQGQKSSPLAH